MKFGIYATNKNMCCMCSAMYQCCYMACCRVKKFHEMLLTPAGRRRGVYGI